MIGHSLALAPRPGTRFARDRWIALGFAIGSACFFIAPLPGFVQLVGEGADGILFLTGALLFTVAAGAELREMTIRLERRFSEASWWSAAVQFAGTLWFNVSTFDAKQTGLSTHQQNRLVRAPDLIGSGCFLASGALAYGVTTRPHILPARILPASRDHAWKMAAINLAGCVVFAVSSIASFAVPSTGSLLAVAPANWCTALGALCFFIGAVLLSRRQPHTRRVAASPPVSQEV